MVTCTGVVPEINFPIFSNNKIASSWFEARATMLFKHTTTVEKRSGTKIKIPKIADMNIIKTLRI